MKKTVEVLWTGGYDSSFRIAQLSRRDVVIRPYYSSGGRQSEARELEAIETISGMLRANPQTRCELLPLEYVPKSACKLDPEVSAAFHRLRQREVLGTQYERLGAFALEHHGIEMSIHKHGRIVDLIDKYGAFIRISDEAIGDYYVIDPEKTDRDLTTVFGNCHFPLVDYAKLDMKEEYARLGLNDVMAETWFCHTPIHGRPCGICTPCVCAIQEGMGARFTKTALIRYALIGKHKSQLIRNPLVRKLNKAIRRK